MGLIKAGIGALGGTLADQWKEFFYCESLPENVMAIKGKKRITGRSSNTKGNDNIISNGSGIAVADGQCMMIVEQGRVVEVCAEPGEYTFDSSAEPSIFAGSLGKSVAGSLKTVGRRFGFGGDPARDQRVYYFNLKELIGNRFGTPNPIPFRVVDRNIGLDIDVAVRCSGMYSYKITDPVLFYANVCGNVAESYTRDQIDGQLKTEFITALQPAFAKISQTGVRPSDLPSHAADLAEAMNAALTEKWAGLRGLSVVSVALNPITLTEEDAELIKQAQRVAILRDPLMGAATLTGAQADAMRAAAENKNGAMTGFMGMGMAMQAGGSNPASLYAMGAGSNPPSGSPAPGKAPSGGSDGSGGSGGSDRWTCSCGHVNDGKFCTECGAARPEEGWVCACGKVNKGKFCSECGAKKPADAPLYRCDKCGWEPEDPRHPPKFCPNCGDRFDERDEVD